MPFPKGISGNPGGLEKHKLFRKALREVLTYEEAKTIAKVLVRKAKRGNLLAVNMVADRLDGKPQQSIDVNDERSTNNLAERFAEILASAAKQDDSVDSGDGEAGTGRVN